MFFEMIKKAVQNRTFIFALLYGVLGLLIMYVMTSDGMGVSVDSERYLIAADHLKEMQISEALRTAFPHFPLFYPLTVALVGLPGSNEGVGAARMVSILCFVVSLMAVFLLGQKIQGKPTAHLSTVSVLIFAPLIYTFSYCWSETLYIALSLFFLLTLILFLNAPQGKETKYLVGSAVFAGLGFLTRYIGFSLIGTGFLVIFFSYKRGRTSKRLKQILLFGLVSASPMLIHLLVDFLCFGTLARKSAPSPFSLSQQLGRFFVIIYRDFLSFDLSFEKYTFLFSHINPGNKLSSPFFWFGLVILLCLLFLSVFFIRLILSSESFRRWLKLLMGCAIYVALYGLLLIGITSSMQVDPIGTRFTTPLYPVFVLLVFSCVFHIRGAFDKRRLKRLILGWAILATFLFGVIQLISTASIYTGISSGSFPAMGHPGNHNRASLRFLQRNLSPGDLVVTNIPNKLSYIWPRETPYRRLSRLDQLLSQMAGQTYDSSVWVLLSTQDRDLDPFVITFTEDGSEYVYPLHLGTPTEQCSIIEEGLTGRGLFYRRIAFGYDYLYRLVFVEEIKKP